MNIPIQIGPHTRYACPRCNNTLLHAHSRCTACAGRDAEKKRAHAGQGVTGAHESAGGNSAGGCADAGHAATRQELHANNVVTTP